MFSLSVLAFLVLAEVKRRKAEQLAEKLKFMSFRSRRTFSVNRGALRAEEFLLSRA